MGSCTLLPAFSKSSVFPMEPTLENYPLTSFKFGASSPGNLSRVCSLGARWTNRLCSSVGRADFRSCQTCSGNCSSCWVSLCCCACGSNAKSSQKCASTLYLLLALLSLCMELVGPHEMCSDSVEVPFYLALCGHALCWCFCELSFLLSPADTR